MEVLKRETQLKKEGEQKIRSPDYEASLASPSPNHGHGRHGRSGVNGKRDLELLRPGERPGCTRPRQLKELLLYYLLSMLPELTRSASSSCFVVLLLRIACCISRRACSLTAAAGVFASLRYPRRDYWVANELARPRQRAPL